MYEAMKMENTIYSEKDGVVSRIKVKPGDTILEGDVLMEIA
jgi:biotin carboxyl carrier protein